MAKSDANVSRFVLENIVRRTAVHHEMDRGRFEHLVVPRGANGLIFSYLSPLTFTCIPKTKRLQILVAHHFVLLFNR